MFFARLLKWTAERSPTCDVVVGHNINTGGQLVSVKKLHGRHMNSWNITSTKNWDKNYTLCARRQREATHRIVSSAFAVPSSIRFSGIKRHRKLEHTDMQTVLSVGNVRQLVS